MSENRTNLTTSSGGTCNGTLLWRHDELEGVSICQPHDCLLNRLFKYRSKITSKLRVTGLCEGNSPMIGEFPTQRTSDMENVSIWWCHHDGGCMMTSWLSGCSQSGCSQSGCSQSTSKEELWCPLCCSLNKLFNKLSNGQWFEILLSSCDFTVVP